MNKEHKAKLIDRLIARLVDMFIVNTTILFIIYYFSKKYFLYTTYLYVETMGISITTLFMPMYFIIDTIITKAFGNNIGKTLIGIKTEKNDNTPLSFKENAERNIIIYIAGYFCGIPILSGIAQIIQYKIYLKEKTTSWDKRINTRVNGEKSNTLRSIIILIGYIIIQYNFISFVEKNNEINQEIQKSIEIMLNNVKNNKNYNRYDNPYINIFGKEEFEKMLIENDQEKNKQMPQKINKNTIITKMIEGEDTIYLFYKIFKPIDPTEYNEIQEEYCKNINEKYNNKGLEIITYQDNITETKTIIYNPTECIK